MRPTLTSVKDRAAAAAAAAVVVTASLVIAASGTAAEAETRTETGRSAPAFATIQVGSNPSELVVSKDKRSLYVLNDGSVSIVDTRTQKQTAEFNTGFQDQSALGLMPGGRLLLGTFDDNALKLVAPGAQKVVAQADVGLGATGVATAKARAGKRAYVSLLTSQQVVVVNPRNLSVVARINLPQGPQTIEATPDGRRVWAGSSYSGRVWVIDPRRNRVVRRIAVDDAGPVTSIAFGPKGKRAWIAGLGGVQVVSTRTGRELAFMPTEWLFPGTDAVNIGEIALTPNGRRAIVLNSTFPDAPGRGTATVVNTRSLRVTRRLRLGTEPLGLVVSPRRTYVSNYMDDTVSSFATHGSPTS